MGKFDDLTLQDLPAIAARLAEVKFELGDNLTFHGAVRKFVREVDEGVADWEFTAQLFLDLQGLFDSLDQFGAEHYGHQTTQGFLSLLTHLDDLGPEGEKARANFNRFSDIAERARAFVITEDG